MNERVAKLESEVHHLRLDISQIKSDVREMRDTMVGARGAGKALLGVTALLGGVIGWLLKVWVV